MNSLVIVVVLITMEASCFLLARILMDASFFFVVKSVLDAVYSDFSLLAMALSWRVVELDFAEGFLVEAHLVLAFNALHFFVMAMFVRSSCNVRFR